MAKRGDDLISDTLVDVVEESILKLPILQREACVLASSSDYFR